VSCHLFYIGFFNYAKTLSGHTIVDRTLDCDSFRPMTWEYCCYCRAAASQQPRPSPVQTRFSDEATGLLPEARDKGICSGTN